ncbi:hypothetical protein KAZ57_02375 [Patescibacteria group bacterium]|nr:hypothetical protein [Patescibacteria group bacterium]
MELKKLDQSFYTDHPRIEQALDFDMQSGTWTGNKVRGHGIVTIDVNGLLFAIPARTNIKHNAAFILQINRSDRQVKGMGLDYSKSLLISDLKYVTSDVFVLSDKAAGKKLIGKEQHITNQFTKYVEKYISAIRKNDLFVLNSFDYRHTTLINYHKELGIENSK